MYLTVSIKTSLSHNLWSIIYHWISVINVIEKIRPTVFENNLKAAINIFKNII